MRLEAQEFIRRFLLHVLPPGLQRIRHYGFLANRYRVVKLARCRQLLAVPVPADTPIAASADYRDRRAKNPLQYAEFAAARAAVKGLIPIPNLALDSPPLSIFICSAYARP